VSRQKGARRRAGTAMTVQQAREALLLFNEKAERLERSGFIKQLDKTPLSLSLTIGVPDPAITTTAPGEDPVDAFVLTLRFFLQDNEPSSFGRLAEVYEALPIPEALREKFRIGRHNLNVFLDSPVSMSVIIKGNAIGPRRRDVLEIFLYGDLAHAQPHRRAAHRLLTSDPALAAMTRTQFVGDLHSNGKFISVVRKLNLEVLESLQATGKT
jgi:hypothetical protein